MGIGRKHHSLFVLKTVMICWFFPPLFSQSSVDKWNITRYVFAYFFSCLCLFSTFFVVYLSVRIFYFFILFIDLFVLLFSWTFSCFVFCFCLCFISLVSLLRPSCSFFISTPFYSPLVKNYLYLLGLFVFVYSLVICLSSFFFCFVYFFVHLSSVSFAFSFVIAICFFFVLMYLFFFGLFQIMVLDGLGFMWFIDTLPCCAFGVWGSVHES